MSVERHRPDYDLPDHLELDSPDQFKALAHPLRHRLLGLLNQRAATISQCAEALGELKGNVSHHLKVLEQAGLVRLVRTRRVQGGTERYYGRTAWTFGLGGGTEGGSVILRLALGEMVSPQPDVPSDVGLRRSRLSAGQAEAFSKRLEELAREFDAADTPGQSVYGLLVGLYQADVPSLSQEPREPEDPKR